MKSDPSNDTPNQGDTLNEFALNEWAAHATGFDSMAEYLRLDTERRQFVRATEERGGSFVRALGEAARHADGENLKRIKHTWPDYWKTYTEDSNHEQETDA